MLIPKRLFAGNGRQELLLAVAGNSRDADDLAAAHRQMNVLEVRSERIVRLMREPRDHEPRLARRRLTVLRMRQVLADHQARHRPRRFPPRIAMARDRTPGHPPSVAATLPDH